MDWRITAPARGLAAVCLLGVGLASLAWGGVQSWHLRRATASPAELPPSAGASPRTEEAPPGTRLLGEVLSVFDATSYNGEWFVLDRRQDMVHRLDSTGTRTMAIGRAGRGPGEFRIPEALAVYQDTLVVAEFDGTVHRFGLDGTFHGRSRLRVDSCLAVGVFDVVAMSEKPIYLVGCVGRGALQQAFVVQETPAGATRKLAAYTKKDENATGNWTWSSCRSSAPIRRGSCLDRRSKTVSMSSTWTDTCSPLSVMLGSRGCRCRTTGRRTVKKWPEVSKELA